MLRRSVSSLSGRIHPASCIQPVAAVASCVRILPSHIRPATQSFNRTQARWMSVHGADEEDSHSDFKPIRKQHVGASGSFEAAKSQIQKDISTHDVFLYMKGTPDAPKCGFSANVVRILSAYPNVKYGSRDVLEDEYVREAIKQFSDWPTLPQLFIHGEFVGGSDIVGNMYKSGELDKLLAPPQPKKANA